MHASLLPKGIFSAQWIPVDQQGRVDRALLATHLEFEKNAGISGVLALGSTGEFPFFSVDERKELLEIVAELASPLTLYANITDIRPKAVVELGLHAKSLGYKAVGVMPPMFYPVSQADILAFFQHVAEKVDLPVMLYNFPELTGKRIDLPTVSAFADSGKMIAIKQSGGEFAYHHELIALGREKGFAVMSGSDTRLPEVFKLGAAGCIGGLVNIVPELMVLIDRVCRQGQPGDCTAAAALMTELGPIIDQMKFPPNIAAGLEARGFAYGALKNIQSEESRQLHRKIVGELVALFKRHQVKLATSAAA
ncbi:MAG: dihydrodipicolinate synthase family protein [Verrucomicrobiota bacterium]